jgi:hypothetical protein
MIVLSSLPLTIRLPSALKATLQTSAECPLMDGRQAPLGVIIAPANEHEVRHIERLVDSAVVSLPEQTRTDIVELMPQGSTGKTRDQVGEIYGVGGLLSAGHWGTAAVVWAFTREGGQGEYQQQKRKSEVLTTGEFSSIGIRGLSSRPSVIKHRQAATRNRRGLGGGGRTGGAVRAAGEGV